jgi:hypothetical protein
LREEFLMAEEAFALSPISARAALPSEEDYAAISEAFMETSRGRWFLGEYAKRNRNADTRMVLDAVAKIEESIAAQKEAATDSRLTDAIAAIRHALGEAHISAIAALDDMALDQHLAPVRKGARVIREIAWRLREIGADVRICDILDSQVAGIESGAAQISSADARAALDAAFASVAGRLAEFDDDGARPAVARKPSEGLRVVPFPSPSEQPAADIATVEAATVEAAAAAVEMAELEIVEATRAEPVMEAPVGSIAPVAKDAVAAAVERVDETTAEALDEALDLIAAEMSAPDPILDEFEMPTSEAAVAEAPAAAPEHVVEPVEPVAMRATPQPASELAPQSVPEPSPQPAPEMSLGSSIIASGMLNKPKLPVNDPLAPIRRMTQAEKIAFFS